MFIRKLFLGFIFLSLLSSCGRSNEELMVGRWIVTECHMPKMEKGLRIISDGKPDTYSRLLSVYVQGDFFSFNEDHNFTSLFFGHFLHGTWSYDQRKNSILLFPANKKVDVKKDTTEYLLISISSSKMKFRQNLSAKDKGNKAFPEDLELTMIRNPVKLPEQSGDYSSLINNSWRLKPDTAENYEQIKARVSGCINFSILYLSDYLKDRVNGFYLRPIPLPFEYKGRAVYILQEEEINSGWKELFYNDSEAIKGYLMLKDAIQEEGFTPPKRDSIKAMLIRAQSRLLDDSFN